MDKIVYIDIDGTLLDKQKKLHAYTKEVILKIQEKGILVAFVTGRNWVEVEELGKELALDKHLNLAICNNGSYITQISKFAPSHLNLISENSARKIFTHLLNEKNITVFLNDYNQPGIYYSNISKEQNTFDSNLLPELSLKKIDSNVAWDQISIIGFECEGSKVEKYEELLSHEELNVAYSCSKSKHREKPLFMITAKNATKEIAITELSAELGISKENIYVFGDGANDIGMIRMFKPNSYVPNNAPDYVKQECDNIIDAPHDGGIGQQLAKLFL